MSNVIIDRNKIDILANAISDKSGVPVTMTLDEMVDAVDSIEIGDGITPTGNINITQAGVTDVTNYATATVPDNAVIDNGINGSFITINGARKWDAIAWFDYLQNGMVNSGINYASKNITYNAIASGTTVTPTESAQTIGGANYMMEGAVTVSAIPSNYVGSGITQRDSDDLTTSGATVSVPAGYYSAAASKSVASGSATAPASISGTTASISTGTNTITLTKTVSVTPAVSAGYVSSGTAGNSSVSLTASVTVNPTPTASGATVTIPAGYYSTQTTKSVTSGSATGPSSLSGSSATVSTGTNTLTLTKTGVTTTPTVSAGYVSSATASTATVTLTASVTTKAAATITPTTTNQTIAAGTYLTGAQTIAGDADLVASNIVSGVQIFGVTGNVVLQNYYTGSSAPSSSLGQNGDIYLQETGA